jgi:hypothetical protein
MAESMKNMVGEPVRIFISYASEDDSIRNALSDALDELNTKCGGTIASIYDKKSLDAGLPVPLISEISNQLSTSDYFVVIYTGTVKKAFSWTGTELGIFWTLIRTDGAARQRKIVAVFFDERPPVDWGALGIDLSISQSDLQQSAEEFRKILADRIQKGNQYSILVNTFETIAKDALSRLPDQIASNLKIDINAISENIKNTIVPNLLVKLHTIYSGRIKLTNIEQYLIRFTIPATDDWERLPEETTLVQQNNALALFKEGLSVEEIKWRDLKESLGAPDNADRAAITAAVERSIISAISPDIARDDEQVIRSPADNKLYRVIVTSRYELFDGRTLVHVYFIPTMRFVFLDDSDVAVTLAFINVAVKYRETFVNQKSDLSLLDYYRTLTAAELRSKVRRSVRELSMIEDESQVLDLHEGTKIAIYYGKLPSDFAKVKLLSETFGVAKTELLNRAHLLLAADDDAIERNLELRKNWESALGEFITISDRINSEILIRAIDNLRKYLELNLSSPLSPTI